MTWFCHWWVTTASRKPDAEGRMRQENECIFLATSQFYRKTELAVRRSDTFLLYEKMIYWIRGGVCPLYIVQICNWTRKWSQIMLVLILVGIILSGKLINVEYVTNSAIMRNLEQSYKQRTRTLPWGCFEWLRLNNELQVHPACHVPQSWSAAAGLGLPAAAGAGEVLMWKVA